jgi:lysozyme family protein
VSIFDICFGVIVDVEGALSLDSNDHGSWTGGVVGVGLLRGTKYGISAASYPDLDIGALTLDDAKAIYRRDYWDKVAADQLAPGVALIVFDCAVNQGAGLAARLLQAAVSVRQDGDIGPVTLAAVAGVVPAALVQEFEAQRAVRYASDDNRYWLGWYRRLAAVSARAQLPFE